MINFPICSAETWFSLLFTVLVEIVPASIRSVSIGAFLFLMNNVGGNLPLLVDPLAKIPGVGLQTALYISWPGLTAASKRHIISRGSYSIIVRLLFIILGGVLFLLSGVYLWKTNKQMFLKESKKIQI